MPSKIRRTKLHDFVRCGICNRILRATTITAAERTVYPKIPIPSLSKGVAFICKIDQVYYAK